MVYATNSLQPSMSLMATGERNHGLEKDVELGRPVCLFQEEDKKEVHVANLKFGGSSF